MNENCNCPWDKCAVHPGKLCDGEAKALPCEEHGSHSIGDQVLGEGLHLCAACGVEILKLLLFETVECGQALSPYVTKQLDPLERVVRNYFIGSYEKGLEEGWRHLWSDVFGVMAFFACVLEKNNKIPVDVLEKVGAYAINIRSLKSAIKGQQKETQHETKEGGV